ncbi:MAG: ABC transporter permease, partial [Tannerellaceae bacterium]|nr:ABC transporter permease [Tannerellaceae bacterium]
MNVPFYIARRYLFSKKSHNAINIISLISAGGVIIATVALVCALSVYNGFHDLISLQFSSFDPQLKITPRTGKVFDPDAPAFREVKYMEQVDVYSEVLQDIALLRYKDRQEIGIIKGVDDHFNRLTLIDSILVEGRFALREDIVDYATLGIGLAYALGVKAGFVSPVEIYVPKRDEAVNMVNPVASSNREYIYVSGVFMINQPEYDQSYMVIPLPLARELFRYEKEVSAIEIKLKEGVDQEEVKHSIRRILGENFDVKNRYEQQEAAFKMMQIEKWMTYLILCFILSIAVFNIIGSLCMLMIEKQADVQTLRHLGANDSFIRRIFLLEGWMISGGGAILGIGAGLLLCYLQQRFGLIQLGQTAGAFVIDAYPVKIVASDILTIFITVSLIGLFAAWYPVRYLGRKWLQAKNK